MSLEDVCTKWRKCYVYITDGFFGWYLSYGWYFTFVQGFVYLGLILWYGFRPKHIINPWKTYLKLSGVLMGSQGLTKGSLMFLNYPAQIMFKSTKVSFCSHNPFSIVGTI